MSRLLSILAVCLLSFPAVGLPLDDDQGAAQQAILKQLAGDWATVSRIRDDEKLTEPADGRRVTISGSKFTVAVGEKVLGHGSFVLDPSKKPTAIDIKIASTDGKEHLYLGILEVTANEHKMCWADAGKERPAAFTAKKGSGHTLATYKRVAK